MNTPLRILSTCLLVVATLAPPPVQAVDRFKNFSSTIQVNEVLLDGATAWCATSGGLFSLPSDASGDTLSAHEYGFRDLHMTALAKSSDGTLWIGTKKGYLYALSTKGDLRIINDYYAAQWEIRDLTIFNDILIIASSKGCSIFDPSGKRSTRSSTLFGSFSNSAINAVLVHKDTLCVATNEGVAKLYVGGSALWERNFFDRTIWTTIPTPTPQRSLLVHNGTLQSSSSLRAYRGSSTVRADSATVFIDNTPVELPSKVTCLSVDKANRLWIGTAEDQLYIRPQGQALQRKHIAGLTFDAIGNTFLADDGTLWILPQVVRSPVQPWHRRVSTYREGHFQRIGQQSWISLGAGNSASYRAITQDVYGNIWSIPFGGPVMYYNTATQSARAQWAPIVDGVSLTNASLAMTRDSSDFLWADNSWQGDAGTSNHTLTCIKAGPQGYEDWSFATFFRPSSPYFASLTTALEVNAHGIIIAGTDDGRIISFRHNGNPMAGEIQSIRDIGQLTNDKFGSIKALKSLHGSNDSIVAAATSSGLFFVDIFSGYQIRVQNIPGPVTALALEEGSILWAATQKGVYRFEIPPIFPESKSKTLASSISKLNDTTLSVTTITEENGLIDNDITSLSLDKNKGHLWIGTVSGLSRFNTGIWSGSSDKKSVIVAPNPCSLSRHREVVFEQVNPDATITIFNLSGRPIGTATADKLVSNSSIFTWTPPPNLAPGSYYYTISPKRVVGKLFIIP